MIEINGVKYLNAEEHYQKCWQELYDRVAENGYLDGKLLYNPRNLLLYFVPEGTPEVPNELYRHPIHEAYYRHKV